MKNLYRFITVFHSFVENDISQNIGEVFSKDAMDTGAFTGFTLTPINGVDTEKGIRTWKDPEVFLKALLGFARDYANAGADLRRLMDEGNIDGVYYIAHALKGVAGNLSVTDVANAASNICTAIHDKRVEYTKNQIDTLSESIITVVDAIRQLETLYDVEEMPKKKLDEKYLKRLFTDMLPAFDELSPYALDPFMSKLAEYFTREQLNPISEHIERFDFNRARQETVKLAKPLMISLED